MNIGREIEYIKFKKSTSETKEGLQSIFAFLNKHGKGTIYFGVKDNGKVKGQQIGKDTLNKLSQEMSNHISIMTLIKISTITICIIKNIMEQ